MSYLKEEEKYMRKVFYSFLALFLGFIIGVTSSNSVTIALSTYSIPRTSFTNPVLTWRMLKQYPLGSSVLPVNTPQAREQFENLGWWQEPGVIVGYEAIRMNGEVIMLCQVRTQKGAGYILAVNPSWIKSP